MSGYLVTAVWWHVALIVFWAAVMTGTLLAARRWINGSPEAAVERDRVPRQARRKHQSTLDGEQPKGGELA